MSQALKIMAAVDLSNYSAAIVRYSVWLSKQLNADLLVVNVIHQRDLDMVKRALSAYEAFSFQNYLEDRIQDRKTNLTGLIEEASPGTVKCHCLVRSGIPYRELLSAIDAERPNLMIVGTKGRSNLVDVVVGSTARMLYRRSPIPLLTIPAGFKDLP